MVQKIKKDYSITGLVPAIVTLLLFFLSLFLWGPSTGFLVLGYTILFIGLLVLYTYLRTRHFGSLISTLYLFSFGGFLLSIAPHIIEHQRFEFPALSKILVVVTIFFFYWMMYLNFTRKLKWRGRDILELAAQNVHETSGVHTNRPMPTGNVSYSRIELEAFADFFQRKLLGLCYKESERMVFMPLKYKNEFMAIFSSRFAYMDKSWVAISYDGQVSVNISKKDYFEYKENLAFEELCYGLSDVILEFIDLYLEGSEVRIIDKMDELKISIFA
jgi:hypothetical protein